MVTYFSIHVPMIYNHCPENQTEETCFLRSYLNRKDSVYYLVPYSYQLMPRAQDWPTARDAIDKMHAICAECQKQNNQNTK